MVDRIIAAFTFRQGVYNEAKADVTFTQNAWLIVAVTAFLSQLGAWASQVQGDGGPVGWLIGAIVGTIFAILAFALACYVVVWVGKSLFQTTTTFEEMVRVLGLAYVWNIVGVLGIVGALGTAFLCAVAPISFIAGILALIAFALALKAALGLEWLQTIIVAVVAWVVIIIVMAIAGIVLGILGISATAIAI